MGEIDIGQKEARRENKASDFLASCLYIVMVVLLYEVTGVFFVSTRYHSFRNVAFVG